MPNVLFIVFIFPIPCNLSVAATLYPKVNSITLHTFGYVENKINAIVCLDSQIPTHDHQSLNLHHKSLNIMGAFI